MFDKLLIIKFLVKIRTCPDSSSGGVFFAAQSYVLKFDNLEVLMIFKQKKIEHHYSVRFFNISKATITLLMYRHHRLVEK
jgi:hypothetical protein